MPKRKTSCLCRLAAALINLLNAVQASHASDKVIVESETGENVQVRIVAGAADIDVQHFAYREREQTADLGPKSSTPKASSSPALGSDGDDGVLAGRGNRKHPYVTAVEVAHTGRR